MLENHGPYCGKQWNNCKIEVNNAYIYFSYKTVIAIMTNGKLYITENVWGRTTGKHLNSINDDKSIRLDADKFREITKKIGIFVDVDDALENLE